MISHKAAKAMLNGLYGKMVQPAIPTYGLTFEQWKEMMDQRDLIERLKDRKVRRHAR